MSWQTVNPKGRDLCLNERSDVVNESGSNVCAVLVDPFSWNLLFNVRDEVNVSRLCDAHIGVLGNSLESDNLTCLTLESKLNCRATCIERFGDVDTAGNVRRASLERGK